VCVCVCVCVCEEDCGRAERKSEALKSDWLSNHVFFWEHWITAVERRRCRMKGASVAEGWTDERERERERWKTERMRNHC